MSHIEADDNDADGDLIFISEEHIDLEESSQLKLEHEGEEREKEEVNTEVEGTDIDVPGTSFDIEHVEDDEQDEDDEEAEEQEVEAHEEKLEDKTVGKDGLMIVDEWDDNELESELDDDVKEKDEDAVNPEDIERSVLNMPPLKSVLDDVGHLKQNRRLVIHPLGMEELEHPKLKEIIAKDACEEIKFQFVRSRHNAKLWTGIAVLNFMTNGSAVQAMEEVKQIKDDFTVKLETNTNVLTEQFIKESKTEKRWTDNILVVRNLIEDVKVESLKELFPDAEEIVIHKDASKRRDTTRARGYAFLLYRTDEMATQAAREYKEKKLMLDDHRLYVLQYSLPVESLPRGLLRLRERRVVLKHMEKITRLLEKANEDPSVKVPENAKELIEKCKAVIEKDNKIRKEVNLDAPSWEQMKHMNGLPILTAADCHRFLVRLGIIEEKKDDGHAGRKQDRSKSPLRRDDKNPQRLRKKAPSPRNTRRSPRKRNWGQPGGRNQRPGNMLRNNPGMGGGMINPLALMMQQGMMGTGAMINPGMLMQQNMGAALLGAGGLIGSVPQQNLPFLGTMGTQGSGRGIDEPPNKMLRLDEAGNFQSADNRRFYDREPHRRTESHQRGRDREDRPSMRDVRQGRMQRSRSPERSARGEMRGYSDISSSSGMARDIPSSRADDDAEISNPVNLLLNLSQMLSQKMEQKRQQAERERRGYDRGEYGHGGPR